MTMILDWPADWYKAVSASFYLTARNQAVESPWTAKRSVLGPHAQVWVSKVSMVPLQLSTSPKIWEVSSFLSRLDGQAGLLRMGHVARLQPQWNNDASLVDFGNDQFTKIMLHMDGPDGSLTPVDDAVGRTASHIWTSEGTGSFQPHLTTGTFRFGPTSAQFVNSVFPDVFTTPAHPDFNLGSSDFTVDCWFLCTMPSTPDPSAGFPTILGQGDSGFNPPNSSIVILRLNSGQIRGQVCVGGLNYIVDGYSVFNNFNATWYHVAFQRVGNTLMLSINGNLEGTAAISGSVNPCFPSIYPFSVGGVRDFNGLQWVGYIDEVRLSVGVARWPTGYFAFPKVAYSNTTWSDGTFFSDGTGWTTGTVLPPTVSQRISSPKGANTIAVGGGGLPFNTKRVLRRGDLLEIRPNGVSAPFPHLYEVVQDVTTNNNGAAAVEIRPRLRADVVFGDQVVLSNPTTLFRVMDDNQGEIRAEAHGSPANLYAPPPVLGSFGFTLVEAI